MVYSKHDTHYCLPTPFGGGMHVERTIVARVQPRSSKGITDLLLP